MDLGQRKSLVMVSETCYGALEIVGSTIRARTTLNSLGVSIALVDDRKGDRSSKSCSKSLDSHRGSVAKDHNHWLS